MKERFMKNGVFSLEYDKETLRDMVLELREENQQLKNNWNKLKEYLETCISIIKKNPIDKRTSFEHSSLSSLGATLSKMQELEQGSDKK